MITMLVRCSPMRRMRSRWNRASCGSSSAAWTETISWRPWRMIDTAAGPATVLVEAATLSATFLDVWMGCGRRRGHLA